MCEEFTSLFKAFVLLGDILHHDRDVVVVSVNFIWILLCYWHTFIYYGTSCVYISGC